MLIKLKLSYDNILGVRAGLALLPLLAELGCLPVSKKAILPNAQNLFETDGTLKNPEDASLKQVPAMLDQLEWFAIACRNQRLHILS